MENVTQTPNPAPKAKRKISIGTIVFYSLYVAAVACVLILFHLAMDPLENWLSKYEASQPDHTRDQIFAALFEDPDWDLIYDLAGVTNTTYEGKDEFIAYMENKVGDKALTCQETSAGLTGGKKYIIKLDSEKIATFTMSSSKDGGFDGWKLAQVEVFFTRNEEITVVTMPEYTVYVNDVALDDSFTTKTVSTIAEDYMPNGLHGYRMKQQQIGGFLVEPVITVYDENGNKVDVTYDAENDVYTTEISNTIELTQEFYDIALAAAQANAKYAIRAISAGDLRQYFDPNCQVYLDISTTPVFLQSYRGYTFDETVTRVTDFYLYSEDFFSARVVLKMDITRKDQTIKTYEMDTTYFFTKNSVGNWLVTDMTNVHIQELVTAVRLSYVQDGQLIFTEMVESDIDYIYLPTIEIPNGKVLLGWAVQDVDADGNINYNIVFEATEDGVIRLKDDMTLQPMTLYPVFEAVQ